MDTWCGEMTRARAAPSPLSAPVLVSQAGFGGNVGIIIFNKQIRFSAPSTLSLPLRVCAVARER